MVVDTASNQVDDVVTGAGFKHADEGNQCRGVAIVLQARHRLGTRHGSEPRERRSLARRHAVEFRQAVRKRTDFDQARNGAAYFWTVLYIRAVTQAIKGALAFVFRHRNEAIKPLTLLGRERLG